MVVAVPAGVQVLPSTETYPLKVPPALTSFSHIGALRSLIELQVAKELVAERFWKTNEVEKSTLTPVRAYAEPGASVSRIITPAVPEFRALDKLSNLAIIVPSPVIV
jgi:hypothetical protein